MSFNLLRWLKRIIDNHFEKRANEEILKMVRKWDNLSPEEKSNQPLADFLRSEWDRQDKLDREERERQQKRWEKSLFYPLVYIISFGAFPYRRDGD